LSQHGRLQGPVQMELSRYPTVTVIIPTKDRPFDLEMTVGSVLEQSVLAQQVVIIDQSQNDESHSRIEAQYARAPERIRGTLKLSYIQDAAITGLAAARNRAMELAQGEVWLFLDDDVELEPTFIEELLKVYARFPEAAGVSGVITNYQAPPWTRRLWNSVFMRGPFHDERQEIYWNADRLRQTGPIPASRLGGGLMSFRASAIGDLRFDERLRGVSLSEDVDFAFRVSRRARLLIAPKARLIHKRSISGRTQGHWLGNEAQSARYLYLRLWQKGLTNRFCFLWLAFGLALVATAASVRRWSLQPWRALLEGIRRAQALVNKA
jgi:glucosyl-dolichyl phosphate glucuronosyltransferase